jgi:hypothetical protein
MEPGLEALRLQRRRHLFVVERGALLGLLVAGIVAASAIWENNIILMIFLFPPNYSYSSLVVDWVRIVAEVGHLADNIVVAPGVVDIVAAAVVGTSNSEKLINFK